MTMRSFVPVLAIAVLAVAPGCQSKKSCCPPPSPCAVAPAPICAAPPADMATKADVYGVDDKVVRLNNQVADLNHKIDELRSAPAPMAVMPPPSPMPSPSFGDMAPPAAAGDSEALRFAETLRARGVNGVEQRGGMISVRLADAFRPGSDNLKGDVALAKTLQAVAEGLQLAPTAHVQVVGHTDLTPIKRSHWPDNTALSRARAQTVARVLSENGVRSYIDVDGRGESEPLVSPEKGKSDQSKNRRVEIQVTF